MILNNEPISGTVEEQQLSRSKAACDLVRRLMAASKKLNVQCYVNSNNEVDMRIESTSTEGFRLPITSSKMFLSVYNYIMHGVVPSDFDIAIESPEDISEDFLSKWMIKLCQQLKFLPKHLMPNNRIKGVMKGKMGTLSITVENNEQLYGTLVEHGCIF